MGRAVLERIMQVSAFAPLGLEGLEQIAHNGRISPVAAGQYCFRIGEPANWLSILLEGQMQITQPEGEQERVLITYNAPDFFGEIPILLGTPTYFANARALTDCTVYLLPAEAFWEILDDNAEATRRIMQTMALRINNLQSIAAQRGRQSAVSTLAAGLAHELNNPAAAAVRASTHMAEAIWDVQTTSAELARYLPQAVFENLQAQVRNWLWEGDLPVLTPLTRADREDELAEWLEQRGVNSGYEIVEPLVAAGLELTDLEQLQQLVPPECFNSAVLWLAASAAAAGYVCTVSRSASRVSELVETMRGYAYLDQAPIQDINLNEALEHTLRVLNYELDGLHIVRDYDPSLPAVTGYGAELNGVWTTLIENALQALGEGGTLRLSTRREHERVLVEVMDSGKGIDPQTLPRIFDPFFTTKAVGEGRGLGLSLAYQTIVERHQGDIQVRSIPGETLFQIRLPIHPASPMKVHMEVSA